MNSKFLYLLGLVLLLLAVLPLTRTRPASIEWKRDSAAALADARRDSKTVLAFLYTDWCTYCRRMDATTFTDPGVISELAEEFVWLRLNAETDPQGVEMQRRFGITGYPTILLLDADGRELQRLAGFVPPEQFPGRVRALLEIASSADGRRRLKADAPSVLSWSGDTCRHGARIG